MIANSKKSANLASKHEVCLTPNCGHPRTTRGLCHACYQTARKIVQADRAMEAKLVDLGLLLPPAIHRDSRYREAIEAAMAGKQKSRG